MEAVGAIVGIADVALRTGSKLWSLFDTWKDAPAELYRLRDELTRTQRFFAETQQGVEALYSIQPKCRSMTESHASIRELELLTAKGLEILQDIDAFVDSLAKPSKLNNLPDLGKRRRITWMANAKRVSKWRSELQTMAADVCRLLVVQNVPILTELHLSFGSSVQHITEHTNRTVQEYRDATISELGKAVEISQTRIMSHINGQFDRLEAKLTQSVIAPPIMPKGQVSRSGSIRCACRTSAMYAWRLASPKQLLGSIALEYRSQETRQNCNSPWCRSRRHRQRNIRVTYSLPDWLVRAAVYLLYSNINGSPELVIRVRTLIPGEEIHPQSLFGRVMHGDIEGVRALLNESTASVNDMIGHVGQSPINLAIGNRDIEMIRLLLQAGADPYQEAPNDQGTPLSAAFLWYLDGGGADVAALLPISDYLEEMEFSVLHQIVMGHLPINLAEAVARHPEYLGDVNTTGYGRQTPLGLAVQRGDHAAMRILLDAGADIEAVNGVRRATALHRACLKCDYQGVKMLLEAGASVETRDRHTWAAMDFAATCPSMKPDSVLSLLVRYGADVNGESELGYRPLDHAVTQGTLASVAWLLDHGAEIDYRDPEGNSAIAESILQGWTDKAELLIRRGCDLSIEADQGMTLLHLLARDAEADMMALFTEAGMCVNPGKKDDNGKTAAMIFAERIRDEKLDEAFDALMESVESVFWVDYTWDVKWAQESKHTTVEEVEADESDDEFFDARESLGAKDGG